MKVFFDTNVYIAAALLGEAAERMLEATSMASWRFFISPQVLDEIERVMTERLESSRRFALLTRRRAARRATLLEPPPSRHRVPDDHDDDPILRAALAGGADYLVTNDSDLLCLSPYESLQIVSMDLYHRLLQERGLLP
jgi:putative PIN family toxin of toxin-antitoxin system